MDRSLPANDELEFSVFGRGFGEAICVHLGNQEWMLVDSCINPHTGAPAALTYLESLGLSPARDVRLVIATHWHDDHVRGMGSIVEVCTGATVVCSAVLARPEIVAFIVQQEAAKGALGSGVDELRSVLRTCSEVGRGIVWAKENVPLHPRPPGAAPSVVALSPSDNAFQRALQDLIATATSAKITIPRRYSAPEGPNGASIAVSVVAEEVRLLLGADLETSKNPDTGWDAVLAYARPSGKASAVKIPHHGSAGAHHDGIWSDLLEPEALAVLTPWIRGGNSLPTDTDLKRIRTFSKKVYITAMPGAVLKKVKPDKMVSRLHGHRISEIRGWGHVRARKRSTESEWRVELEGDAVAVA